MKLNEIIKRIENFNTNKETEEYKITEFFDEVGDVISKLGELNSDDKESIILSLFNFLKRQSPELNEDWSFIHLIESIDKPTFEIYNEELERNVKENCTITSLTLFQRHINSLEGEEWKKGLIILKEIAEDDNISEWIREEAQDFYDDHIDDK